MVMRATFEETDPNETKISVEIASNEGKGAYELPLARKQFSKSFDGLLGALESTAPSLSDAT